MWQFVPSESVSHPTKLTTKYKEGLLHLPQAFDRFATSRDALPGGYEPSSSSSEALEPQLPPLDEVLIDRDIQVVEESPVPVEASVVVEDSIVETSSSSENSIVQDLTAPVEEEPL